MKNDIDVACQYVRKRIEFFSNGLNTGVVKAALANLRRGVGSAPGALPELWGYFLQDLPSELWGSNEPSRCEWAIYTALTLYALHQQGHSGENMNQEGSVGKALRQLVNSMDGDRDANEQRVLRRFNQMATSASIKELAVHMRGIIKILSASGIGMDYVDFTKSIYFYQFPAQQAAVRLRWGQDFYYTAKAEQEENNQEEK